jgi:hypothetical protein
MNSPVESTISSPSDRCSTTVPGACAIRAFGNFTFFGACAVSVPRAPVRRRSGGFAESLANRQLFVRGGESAHTVVYWRVLCQSIASRRAGNSTVIQRDDASQHAGLGGDSMKSTTAGNSRPVSDEK